MTRAHTRLVRILAIDPTTLGFGFAVLEGPDRLVDWSTWTADGDKNAAVLRKVGQLLKEYAPDLLVLENTERHGSRRCARVRSLIMSMRHVAAGHGVSVRLVSPRHVRAVFAPAKTKAEIAHVVATRLPELAAYRPPPRRPWMSEDERMGVFDAVALALATLDGSIKNWTS